MTKTNENEWTSIGIKRRTKSLLDKIKVHPRESYSDVIGRLVNMRSHKEEKKK
jgi:predicted CopG family antitoxin